MTARRGGKSSNIYINDIDTLFTHIFLNEGTVNNSQDIKTRTHCVMKGCKIIKCGSS